MTSRTALEWIVSESHRGSVLKEASALLSQDFTALRGYFRRYGVTFDVELTVSELVRSLDNVGVLSH